MIEMTFNKNIESVTKNELGDKLQVLLTDKNKMAAAKKELQAIKQRYFDIKKEQSEKGKVSNLKEQLTVKQLYNLQHKLIKFAQKYIYDEDWDILYQLFIKTADGTTVLIETDKIKSKALEENSKSLTTNMKSIMSVYDKEIKQAKKDQQVLSKHYSEFANAIDNKNGAQEYVTKSKENFQTWAAPEAFANEYQIRHGGDMEHLNKNTHDHKWAPKELALYYDAAINSVPWIKIQDIYNIQVKGVNYFTKGSFQLSDLSTFITLVNKLDALFGKSVSKTAVDDLAKEFARKINFPQLEEAVNDAIREAGEVLTK